MSKTKCITGIQPSGPVNNLGLNITANETNFTEIGLFLSDYKGQKFN